MSETPVLQQENSLPLPSAKGRPLKVYFMAGLVAVILFINYFYLKTGPAPLSKREEIDINEVTSVDPDSHGKTSHPLLKSAATAADENKLREAIAEAKAKDFVERLQAAQTADNTSNNAPSPSTMQQGYAVPSQSPSFSAASDSNTAFLDNAAAERPERSFAMRLSPQPFLIAQGKFIFATLAVAINSDLPGQVSAIVSQDVYGEQGRNILIPRGSRLVGEYRSGLLSNQSRLFVVWTRVIEPNGTSILIGSQGTDALGEAGMTGQVDYHFFARFGTATLISLMGAGAATVGVSPETEYNSMAAYRQAVATAMAGQASNTLSQTANLPSTIHVAQGERVVVFVNKDLDFSKVAR